MKKNATIEDYYMIKTSQKEEFKYLFLDIEWNQAPGTHEVKDREPVQIGIVATDKQLKRSKTFSKGICLSCPQSYNPETLAVSHATYNALMKTNTEEKVLRELQMSFPRFRYLVVWTYPTYELLKQELDKYGLTMPRHQVIVLQSVLMTVAGDGINQIGFERALKQAGVEYEKRKLHYSKYDAIYMYLLFHKCYEEYKTATLGEVCNLNQKTHVLHTGECSFVKREPGPNWAIADKTAIFQSNRICKVCGCKENWHRLHWSDRSNIKAEKKACYLRELSLTEENIGKICNRFRLEYNVARDMVFIRTTFSRWIVYLCDNEVVKLQHENYRQKRGDACKIHKKCMEGYHEQILPSNIFYDVVSYIKRHDTGMMQKLSEKSRMEKIFDILKDQKV